LNATYGGLRLGQAACIDVGPVWLTFRLSARAERAVEGVLYGDGVWYLIGDAKAPDCCIIGRNSSQNIPPHRRTCSRQGVEPLMYPFQFIATLRRLMSGMDVCKGMISLHDRRLQHYTKFVHAAHHYRAHAPSKVTLGLWETISGGSGWG